MVGWMVERLVSIARATGATGDRGPPVSWPPGIVGRRECGGLRARNVRGDRVELSDRHAHDEAAVTSRRIEDAALPIDPDLDQPATPAPARPDRRPGARRDIPAAPPPRAAPGRGGPGGEGRPPPPPPRPGPRRGGAPAGPRPDRGPDGNNLDHGPEPDPDRGAERPPGGGSGGRWRGLGTRLRPLALA